MRRCDNELVQQLIQMPNIHIVMHAEVYSDSPTYIVTTMGFGQYGKSLTRKFTVDDIDIYGFELLLKQMYRDIMEGENA